MTRRQTRSGYHVHVGIPALFTVYNTLDAMACCWNSGVPLEECADALAKNHGVKGRMEIIPTPGKDYTILNDYSHKPDALENVLQSVKGFCQGPHRGAVWLRRRPG